MSVVTPKFKVQFPEWQKQFDEWREVAELEIVGAWRVQARLIAERLIGGIGGGSNWNRATPPGTRKQGQNAVVRDIKLAIFPLKADGFRSIKVRKRVQVAVRNEDIPALQKMVNDGVFGSARVAMKVIPAGNEFTAHQDRRQSRDRVFDKLPKFAVPGDTYLKKYIKQAQQRVGEGKGGWVASLFALGGKCADWISQHRRSGTCIDNLKPGRTELSFSLINRSQWASGGDDERIIDTVMADRAEAIKADIQNRLERSFKVGGRRSM